MENIKQFLLNPDALITRAELARRMFPTVKHANQYLQRKLDEKPGRRLTETDLSNAKAILKEFAERLINL